jgi:hypothetical protein
VLGAFEDERAGAVNWDGTRQGRRVGLLAPVEADGVESHGCLRYW